MLVPVDVETPDIQGAEVADPLAGFHSDVVVAISLRHLPRTTK